jgi:hypothetical protein
LSVAWAPELAVAFAVAAALVAGAIVGHRWARRAQRLRADGPATIVLTDALEPRGIVRIDANVIVRAAAHGPARAIQMDVPTQDVDHVLAAFRTAGLDAHDTGVTVDTDEGEETLTTIGLDLASLSPPLGHAADGLVVRGDLLVETGARIACNVHVRGDATFHDRTACRGALHIKGTLRAGSACTLGDADVGGDAHIGAATTVHRLHARGDVFFADARTAASGVVHARRVHVDPAG